MTLISGSIWESETIFHPEICSSTIPPSWVGLVQIYCQSPVQPRSCPFQCLCELTGSCKWVRRHIMSTLNRWMLVKSRRLLLPDIHRDPLLSCFLTFQDKNLKTKLQSKINMLNLPFFALWHGSNKRDLLTGLSLRRPILKYLIQSHPLNTPKRNGRPIMKKHETGARIQDSSPGWPAGFVFHRTS